MVTTNSIVRLLLLTLVFVIGFFATASDVSAQTTKDQKVVERDDNDDDENLSAEDRKSVKITYEQARAIALKRITGTVIDGELEKENGRLQYAFDIKDAAGNVFDVEIDAMTGEILQAEKDDEDGDGEGDNSSS